MISLQEVLFSHILKLPAKVVIQHVDVNSF
jgi:hypothetical protein